MGPYSKKVRHGFMGPCNRKVRHGFMGPCNKKSKTRVYGPVQQENYGLRIVVWLKCLFDDGVVHDPEVFDLSRTGLALRRLLRWECPGRPFAQLEVATCYMSLSCVCQGEDASQGSQLPLHAEKRKPAKDFSRAPSMKSRCVREIYVKMYRGFAFGDRWRAVVSLSENGLSEQ
ncbi:hypothetical protein CRG98_012117, partial [Punica granatum]